MGMVCIYVCIEMFNVVQLREKKRERDEEKIDRQIDRNRQRDREENG